MPVSPEQIGELRADMRHLKSSVDMMLTKQDELMDRLGNHLIDNAKDFARVDKRMEVAEASAKAERRGVSKATHIMHAAVMTALAFVAGLTGGHVKLPGLH